MLQPDSRTITLHRRFSRHDSDYCLFSIDDCPYEILCFSHRKKRGASLFYGSGFYDEIPQIEQEKPDLCIECGPGTRIKGGVSLDGGDIVAWRCSIGAANRILTLLAEKCRDAKTWITPFPDERQE